MEMKHIKSIFRSYQFEHDAIAQFESIKCKTTKCGFLHFTNDMKYGSRPNALGSLGILLAVKTRAQGSLSPLKS